MTPSSVITWNWISFDQLRNEQLYSLLKLRQDVFIIEQDCIYPDIDGLDPDCLHLLGYIGEELVAYLRLIPVEAHCSGNICLGRIISIASKRGSGIGQTLMQQAMDFIIKHYPEHDIQLSAQYHLQDFYHRFGFRSSGEPYDEDGILHIKMLFLRSGESLPCPK